MNELKNINDAPEKLIRDLAKCKTANQAELVFMAFESTFYVPVRQRMDFWLDADQDPRATRHDTTGDRK